MRSVMQPLLFVFVFSYVFPKIGSGFSMGSAGAGAASAAAGGVSARSSAIPLRIVVGDSPVTRATRVTPPRPAASARSTFRVSNTAKKSDVAAIPAKATRYAVRQPRSAIATRNPAITIAIGTASISQPAFDELYERPRNRFTLLNVSNDAQAAKPAVEGALEGPIELEENGVRFLADPGEGQKTGWFFDQRENRARVAALAKDARLLDLYSYCGGFALQAAVPAVSVIGPSGPIRGTAARIAAIGPKSFVSNARRAAARSRISASPPRPRRGWFLFLSIRRCMSMPESPGGVTPTFALRLGRFSSFSNNSISGARGIKRTPSVAEIFNGH